MATSFPDSLLVAKNKPLDEKSVVQTIYDRDHLPLNLRYKGMVICVQNSAGQPAKYYKLESDDLSNDGWMEIRFGGGGGGGTAVEQELGDNITVTNQISTGLPVGTNISSTDSTWNVLKKILNPVTNPTYTQPSLSLSGSQPLNLEIGENITPVLTPSWSKNDAGALTQYRLYKGGTNIYTGGSAVAQTDGSFVLSADVTYNAQADYGQGAVKNDSEGNPYPTGQIAAGTKTSGNVVYSPKRKAFFGSLDGLTIPNNSAFIRSLTNFLLNPAAGSAMAGTIPIGAKGICFAYPATLRAATSIVSALIGNIPTGNFEHALVSVEGANGYTAIDYHVYYTITAAPFSMSDTYTLNI